MFLGHRLGAILAGKIIYDDIGAGFTQRDRHCFTNPRIGSGYQCLLTG